MNRSIQSVAAALLLLPVLTGCEAFDSQVHVNLEKAQGENEELRQQISSLEKERDTFKQRAADLSKAMDRLEAHVDQLEASQEGPAIAKLKEYLGANFPKRVIMENGRVVRVDMSDIEFRNEDLAIFQTFPKLRRLTLWGAGITDEGMGEVAKLTQITHLTLFNTELTSAGLEKLKPLAGNLEALNLRRSTYLTDDGLAHLTGFDKLVQLDLLYNNFTNDVLAYVNELEQLKVLDLRGCVLINDAGLEKLKSLTQLKALKLRNAGMSDQGLAVVENFPHLQLLFVQDGNITDEGLKHLKGLKEMQDLTLYSLYAITDAGLDNLAGMTKLKTVSLRDTRINGSGLKNFVKMDQLEQLNISETETNNEGLAHLKDLTSLTYLDLWQTKINDEGVEYLKGLKNLTWLSLAQTPVTNGGLNALAGLTKLEELDLQETDIDDEGLPALEGLEDLKTLSVANTQVTREGVATLKEKLPNLTKVVQ